MKNAAHASANSIETYGVTRTITSTIVIVSIRQPSMRKHFPKIELHHRCPRILPCPCDQSGGSRGWHERGPRAQPVEDRSLVPVQAEKHRRHEKGEDLPQRTDAQDYTRETCWVAVLRYDMTKHYSMAIVATYRVADLLVELE